MLLRAPAKRIVAVRALMSLRSGWLVFGLLIGLLTIANGPWRIAILVICAYYGYTRLFVIFWDLLSVRYRADRDGVMLRRGIVGKEEEWFPWSSVVAVTSTRTIVDRIFRVSDVHLTLRASQNAAQVIPSLGSREHRRLEKLHSSSRPVQGAEDFIARTDGEDALERSNARVITPKLRLPDYLVIGITSGTFLLLLPSAYSAAAEISGMFGGSGFVLPTVGDLRRHLRADGRTLLLGAGLTVLSIAYGGFIAWLRYRRYAVSVGPHGRLVFTAGLARQERRVVERSEVAAFELRRSPVFLLTGRASVRAVVRGMDGLITRGHLLPLARHADALEMLRDLSGVQVRAWTEHRRSRSSYVLIPLCWLLAMGMVVCLPIAAGTQIAVVGIFVVLFRWTDATFGAVHLATSGTGSRWAVIVRGVVFRSMWMLPLEAVDVSRWSGFQRNLGVLQVCVRGPRVLSVRTWPSSSRDAADLRMPDDPARLDPPRGEHR